MWTTEHPKGATILVLVAPRASRTKVVGVHDGRLKVQLSAPPVDGAANTQLVEFIAGELGVRRGDVGLISGQSSRRKTLLVTGVTPDEVRRALQVV